MSIAWLLEMSTELIVTVLRLFCSYSLLSGAAVWLLVVSTETELIVTVILDFSAVTDSVD